MFSWRKEKRRENVSELMQDLTLARVPSQVISMKGGSSIEKVVHSYDDMASSL
jgi:hypothetical protein